MFFKDDFYKKILLPNYKIKMDIIIRLNKTSKLKEDCLSSPNYGYK